MERSPNRIPKDRRTAKKIKLDLSMNNFEKINKEEREKVTMN